MGEKRELYTTAAAGGEILRGESRKGFFARALPFLGPAFVASVAYVDPGNFATNIEAGAQNGYMLLWVIVAANLIAMFVQSLSAKLGIATGKNLAELCREHLPRPLVILMWVVAEVVAMATDLAEFLGAAIGFQLLLHIPLFWGALLTALVTLGILMLENYGFRPLEIVISLMVGLIAVCYVIETLLERPDPSAILYNAFVPRFAGRESVLLAAGILGATVMPHVIYLHSALTQGRIIARTPAQQRMLFHFELADVVIALGIAGLVNAAMLIMSASTFHFSGYSHIASIEEAHLTLTPLLGRAAAFLFALSLLASGISSSVVGTMSGQVVMQGFLHWRIPLLVRRLVTIVPSLVVIGLGLDPTRTLVLSQVVLSFGIPFALAPLIHFTAQRRLMGVLANRRTTTAIALLVGLLIIALNVFLLYQTFTGE